LRDPSSTQPDREAISWAHLAALGRLRVDAVAVEVAGELERAGMPSILLKGRSIADWLYDKSEPRTYGDADLLVRSGDRPRAEAALERLGFAPERDASWIEGWSNPAQPWLRAGDGSVVDLHVSLPGAGVPPDTLWGVLAGETEPMRLAGAELRVLTPPARAVHLALHVTQHEGERGQALRDLQLANQLDAIPAFGLGLRMVSKGDAVADRLGLLRFEQTRSALEMSRLRQSLRAVKDAPTVGARVNMLIRKLVPSPCFMRQWSSLAQRGFGGLALAYLWRPFWLLGRIASAIAGGLSRRHRLLRDSSSPR
jgi:hypothetical protein